MRSINLEIDKLVYKVFKNKNPILAELIINWSKIVGHELSKKTTPFKISSFKEKGVKINILYISVENSSTSMEISYQQDMLIERIAVYLGHKAIRKIKTLTNLG